MADHVPTDLPVDAAVDAAVALATGAHDDPSVPRVLLGIAGSPGAGKTTLARRIVVAVTEALGAGVAVHVPMDGFHLADVSLGRLGRRGRKGAIDTFDAAGYVALMRRIVAAREVVWAPDFDRRVDEPVAASIEVPVAARFVVTEGNYLLDEDAPWSALPALFTETWFCAASDEVRVDRLVARHMRHGREFDAARAWAEDVDGGNAARIEPTAARATRVVRT